MTVWDDALVGLLVGSMDVALLWPLVVIASRREAGSPSVMHAIRQRNLWAGGLGGLTLLVPYCSAVEALSNMTYNQSSKETSWPEKMIKAPFTSFVIALGLQPIEKKIVMDALFQTDHTGRGPIADVVHYAKTKGVRRLITSGLGPLWARETIYVAAVTVLNPMMTTNNPKSSMVEKCVSAFGIGFCAGMISAPLQTLNVMQKDERNAGRSLNDIFLSKRPGEEFSLKRMFYGSATRSLRTGAAGVLWFVSRAEVSQLRSS